MKNILNMNTQTALKNQRGAMFGMDARIALIIASILAATGGVAIMSKIERDRVATAERSLEVLRDGLISYYETVNLGALPADMATLLASGVFEETVISADSWGAAWNYTTISDNTQRIADIPVTIHYATLHSSGKDGTNNSAAITLPAEYATWAPGGDDVGIKFSTIEIDKQRANIYREQAKIILDKLNAFESGRYLTLDQTCTTTPADPDCNDSGKSYTQYNFYPESNPDGGGSAVYYNNVAGDYSSYLSANQSDMEQLMTDIGLPTDYATDPWGQILNYDSNATGRSDAPFTASIWY